MWIDPRECITPIHESLAQYEQEVEAGFLSRKEMGDLVLYNYTDHCVYEKHWNEVTLSARGIIFEKTTGKCVARPFAKFFNLGEMNTTIRPDEEYVLMEKMDGSLGIIYWHNGKWDIATRGSFSSDQANYAREHLLPKYHLAGLNTDLTLMVEIIYPENRIVVPYGDRRELVLLGCYSPLAAAVLESHTHVAALRHLAFYTGMHLAPIHELTVDEAVARADILPGTSEGWVLWYPSSDYRIKIKGKEYLRIHKIVTNLSPLSFWEVMQGGSVPQSYLDSIPEEFRGQWEGIREDLERQYKDVLGELELDMDRIPPHISLTDFRQVGIYLNQNPGKVRHAKLIFPMLRGNVLQVDKAVMTIIRPNGNKMRTQE